MRQTSLSIPRRASPASAMLHHPTLRPSVPLPATASTSGRPTLCHSAHQQQRHRQRSSPMQSSLHDQLHGQCAEALSGASASMQALRRTALQAGAAVSLALLMAASPASAAPVVQDAAEVGTCLLGNCQGELLQCIGDQGCLSNLICLNSCANAPDVTACQLRCGDLYEDKAVTIFNNCALSRKKCVAQRVDENLFPVPPECGLVKAFDIKTFTGRWYITAGLNPLFDLFDCQVHYFDVPEDQPNTLVGTINWRISKGEGDFLERSTKQTFVQQANPALLWNHGNQYLHYEDDWYIIAEKPNEYVFIYYKGNNDAWQGYGGAVVYTRTPTLDPKYIPELKAAADAAGIDWDKIKLTDNTCAPKKSGVKRSSPKFESGLKSFGKGFTVVESGAMMELAPEDRGLGKKVQDIEELLELVGKRQIQAIEDEEKALGIDKGIDSVKEFFGHFWESITQVPADLQKK